MPDAQEQFYKTANFFLWPFKFLMDCFVTAMMIVAVIMLFFAFCVWWFVYADVDHLNDAKLYARDAVVWQVDFRKPAEVSGVLYPITISRGQSYAVSPFSYCPERDPAIPTFTGHRESLSWEGVKDKFNGYGWLEKKSAHMYRAYVIAGMSIAALRNELVGAHGTCSIPERSAQLDFRDAPVVHLNYFSDPGIHHPYGARFVLGMYKEHRETSDLLPVSNQWQDLGEPTLTSGQREAYSALLETNTEAFWIRVAHRNGIYDDARIKAAAEITRQRIAALVP